MAKYKCLVNSYTGWKKGCIYDEANIGLFTTVKWTASKFPDDWELVNDNKTNILIKPINNLRKKIALLKHKLKQINNINN
jgi:hypothetical protein